MRRHRGVLPLGGAAGDPAWGEARIRWQGLPSEEEGPRGHGTEGHHIPDALREQVWIRDEGRCTFVSDAGRRCSAEGTLDIDHKLPVGKGGETKLDNLRLLCPAHNQYEADRAFGAGFMAEKRAQVREQTAAVSANVSTPSETQVPEPEISTVPEQVERAAIPAMFADSNPYDPGHTALLTQRADIVACLRTFDFKLAEAKLAATWCDHLLGQSLQVCVKYALKQLVMPRFRRCSIPLSKA